LDYESLIKNLAQNELTIEQRELIFKLLENNRRAKIALKANYYFHLGHPLDLTKKGAFAQAGRDTGCHARTAQRHYYAIFPKRSLFIEREIEPALSFPFG